ncbi:MATE family efflux transporter [Anaerovorax odorimutans]|uniref:MATE family efflux transporter n=1 Tax=Anaerovorax odorimutans TaxID=109327 RepID=UPI00040EC55A|nr:MATE family efflux transporter [Anaerovorax odorimutans]
MNNVDTKNIEIFRSAPIPKVVMLNVIPSIISMIMVLIYNLADTFFIGQTDNAYMVAAVSLVTPVFLLFMAVGLLFGIGGTSLISRKLGEGNIEVAKGTSSFCFWTGIIIGLLGLAIIQIGINPICNIIGATPDTMVYVKQYLRIIAIGIPFLIVSNIFSNIIRAEGKANLSMMGMILGNLINIILDPIMILGFQWNVVGAAIATILGNMASTLFYVGYFLLKKSFLSINIKEYKLGNGIAKGVVAIGIPASLNSILMSISNIIINNFMTDYGDMAIAGLGVAMKVNMIAVMLLIGTGAGIQPILGFCFGSSDKKRFNAALKFSLLFSIILSMIMSLICYIGAGPMVSAFLTEPNAHLYGIQFSRILIISGPILGILFVLTNTIQAMGAAIPSLILSISRQGLIYIPVLIIFSKNFSSAAMLVSAQPVTDYISTIISIFLYLTSYRKYFVNKEAETTNIETLSSTHLSI